MAKIDPMDRLPREIAEEIGRIAQDRESGASALLDRAAAVLRAALGGAAPVDLVAREICLSQPGMAGLWNASLAAVAARHDPALFGRYCQRLARAPRALSRWGLAAFTEFPASPLRIATISASRSVRDILLGLAAERPVHVFCAEGRPALEGRALAATLAASAVPVTCFSDAAIGAALEHTDGVLVGADTIAPAWFLNKVGTRMLVAAAAQLGCPVYVAATREKFMREPAARRLAVRQGAAEEIWATPPAGVIVRNPYFEAIPLDFVSAVITESGIVGTGAVSDICDAAPDDRWLDQVSLPAGPTTRLP